VWGDGERFFMSSRHVRLWVLIAPVVLSVGNSILVLVSNLWPSDASNQQTFTSLNMLQLLVMVEVAIIGPLLCFYMSMLGEFWCSFMFSFETRHSSHT
jgi:hypothetical protein